MTKEDLQLVPYEDLIGELESRFDVCIFAGTKSLDKKDEESRLTYHGGKFTCIGLCVHLIDMLKKRCREKMEFYERGDEL